MVLEQAHRTVRGHRHFWFLTCHIHSRPAELESWKEHDNGDTANTARSEPAGHGVNEVRGSTAAENRGAERSRAGGGGPLPGVPRGVNLPEGHTAQCVRAPLRPLHMSSIFFC